MYTKYEDEGFAPLRPGISMKVVGHGEHTLSALFHLEAGRVLPLHEHLYEQTGTLLKGRLTLMIEGDTFQASPGDTWTIPPHVPHQAEVPEDCLVFEVFSPVREDYLERSRREG